MIFFFRTWHALQLFPRLWRVWDGFLDYYVCYSTWAKLTFTRLADAGNSLGAIYPPGLSLSGRLLCPKELKFTYTRAVICSVCFLEYFVSFLLSKTHLIAPKDKWKVKVHLFNVGSSFTLIESTLPGSRRCAHLTPPLPINAPFLRAFKASLSYTDKKEVETRM